jgi:hypothetical protein
LGWLVVFVWVDMACPGKWLYWLYFGFGEIFGLGVDGGWEGIIEGKKEGMGY